MSNVLVNISYCNKASNRIVFKQEGISVFFWIILSHKVSRHFPTCTHPHSNILKLQESSVYSLYTGGYTPSRLNVCKHLFPLHYSYSLRVSAVLDHFGYPAPYLDQWQQRVWYDLGATQEILHQMRTCLS